MIINLILILFLILIENVSFESCSNDTVEAKDDFG